MSTSRHIDKICIAAVLLTLVLTVLFMNGRALGITPIEDGDSGDGPFTANDLDGTWDSSGAARIALTGDGADIDGGGAYLLDGDVHIAAAGRYVLTGELTDGSVVVDANSGDKIWLLLDGVSLRCEDSAALRVEQAEKVFLTLAEGSENAVSSGAEYSGEAVDAGIDGAVYSRDDLTINGGGSLTVTAEYRHGIVCNDDFVITGGTVRIEAPQDGIHANDSARFTGMDLTIDAGDDGITVSNDEGTGYFHMESGALSIPACYEGVEAADITVAGGTLDVVPTDDGLNANGGGESAIHITGGSVRVVNDTGRDADGLDSNGSIYISGGYTFLSLNGSGGNCALDAGTESGGVCEISGGTVIACGGSMMAEGFDSGSPQGFLMRSVSGEAGTAVALRDASGQELLREEIPCAFTSLVLSAPGLKTGDACTLLVGDTEEAVTIDNTAASGGFGMGGGRFNGGTGGGPRRMANGAENGAAPGEEAQLPERPETFQPSEDFQPPEGFQLPEGGQRPDFGGQRPDMGGMDGDQFTRPDRGETEPVQNAGTSAPSPEALLLTGLSALVLLAGLVIAFKYRAK